MQDGGFIDVGHYAPKPKPKPQPRSGPGTPGYIGFKATPKPPAAPRVSAPPPRYTPGPVRYSSGKSVGSNSTGRITPIAPPPPPKPPSIQQWLSGDATYKQQQDAMKKAMADYQAQMTGQQNNYETEYNRNLLSTQDAEKLAQTDTENDYASRGLSTSGLYLKALNDLHTDYDKREGALADGRAEFLANLAAGLTNFQSTQGLNNTKYRNDAINRRAQKYGL